MYKKNKGFTIVELIVVMAIIAILVIMAVPTMQKYIKNAKLTSTLATAETIYNAAIAYEADHITDPKLLDIRVNGYIDYLAPSVPHDENSFVQIGKSYLDPYIDGNVSFLYGNMPQILTYTGVYDVFCVRTLILDGYDLKAPIVVYYNDPRMPTQDELSNIDNNKFWYMATGIVNGVPMVIGASDFPGATGTNYMVPISEYVAEYENEINK